MSYITPTIEATTRLSAFLFNYLETQFDEMKEVYDESDHDNLYYTQIETNLRFAKKITGLVSNLDADKIDGYHIDELLADGLPIGSIVWWYGAALDIPDGWNLCDGSNGTTDFRDKFIVGKGTNYDAIGNNYGSLTKSITGSLTIATHSLTSDEVPLHEHEYLDGYGTFSTTYSMGGYEYITGNDASEYRETYSTGSGTPHGHTGSTVTLDDIDIMPSYVALYLIKRLS